jgi:hypothetical protein
MPNIFSDFNWSTSLYRPALELPEVRRFRPGSARTIWNDKDINKLVDRKTFWILIATVFYRNFKKSNKN